MKKTNSGGRDLSVLNCVRISIERTAGLLKWKMVGEVLIPGVLNVGDIENTDGYEKAAALAENLQREDMLTR